VFEVQAGDKLVGVSAYTDYPPAANDIPVIGDAFVVDREQLALLKPDMLLAWESGTPTHVVERLREAGYRVEVIRTQALGDIGAALERIGVLAGHAEQGQDAATAFRDTIRNLQERYAAAAPISVFYQISRRPLYTVNGEHYISELIELCGGQNVFADIGELAPMIDVEAVIDRNPEVMLAGEDSRGEAFDEWDRWPEIAANRFGNRFFMPASVIGRATTRLAIAAEAVCEALQQARKNRGSNEVHANG
jgi:iron complex transport system substrate-binding protein